MRNVSLTDHLHDQLQCADGLICYQRLTGGTDVPGCVFEDNNSWERQSAADFCILPPPPTTAPTLVPTSPPTDAPTTLEPTQWQPPEPSPDFNLKMHWERGKPTKQYYLVGHCRRVAARAFRIQHDLLCFCHFSLLLQASIGRKTIGNGGGAWHTRWQKIGTMAVPMD